MKENLLPEIKDSVHYHQLFEHDSLWEPAITHLKQHHNLQGALKRGIRGSHIVYRVGAVWIKLMAPIFAKDMAFEIAGLSCVDGKLDASSPKILFQGELEGWPYIILSHVEGERIGDVFNNIEPAEQLRLAEQMASVTKSIQRVQPNKVIHSRGYWNSFIRERLKNFQDYHRTKNVDSMWLNEMPSFIGSFPENEFMTNSPLFIHSDLTWDHFLVQKNGGVWEVTGIIDFADCRLGHPEYEMVTPILFIFKKNRLALRKFLEGMDIPARDLNEKLSEKLMAWSILHLYSNLNNCFLNDMNKMSKADYSSLAKLVFPL